MIIFHTFAELFDRVRLYNVPIRQIRSELVSNYIRDVIDSILPWLEAVCCSQGHSANSQLIHAIVN